MSSKRCAPIGGAAIAAILLPLAFVLFLQASAGEAAPKAELWPRWQAHDPSSQARIDHTAWDRFLATYLVVGTDGVNRLRYAAVDEDGRRRLEGYIESLTSQPISRFARAAQMAYWINLYNALTVKVVLDHYPVESILDIDISPGLFANGPWGRELVVVEGERLSLDDIEHRILRPIWRDARIHYVVNCASIGCPDLAPTAYSAQRLEAMLEDAARDYVNDPRGVAFARGRVVGSKLYDWYKGDFGANDREVIGHLRRFAEPELAARLASVKKLDGHRYDWALNDAATSPAPRKTDMEDQRQSR